MSMTDDSEARPPRPDSFKRLQPEREIADRERLANKAEIAQAVAADYELIADARDRIANAEQRIEAGEARIARLTDTPQPEAVQPLAYVSLDAEDLDVAKEVEQALHDYRDETGWRYLAGLDLFSSHLAVNVFDSSPLGEREHRSNDDANRWQYSISVNGGSSTAKRYAPERYYPTRERANRAATIAVTNLLMNERTAND